MKEIQVSMLLRSRLVYILLMITVIWCRIFLLRLLTMRPFLHQLKPGVFDLVGTIVYEIDQNPYQSNETTEVNEAGGLLSVESVFLFCLGIALIGLLVLWTRSQIQQFSLKTKKAPKVEVGTRATDTSMDEWLQGTVYSAASTKLRKK